MRIYVGEQYSPWFQCFAAFIPDAMRGEAALDYAAALLRVAEQRQGTDFRLVRTAADFDGDCACHALLTGEGIGAVESVVAFDQLYAGGMRAATLTWNGDNAWASGCLGSDGGLTSLGKQALSRMESLGITVDVSHLGSQSFWDVARLGRRPFIASHSNAAGVYPHPRNLTDWQFRAIRDSGGIVGLNFYRPHLGEGDFFTAFRRHLEHFLSLDGENTVCIGTDFDGMDSPPEWHGMAFIQKVYKQLLSCGYSAALLDKVFYTNARRFFEMTLA